MSYSATELDVNKPARSRVPLRHWKGIARTGNHLVTVELWACFIAVALDLMCDELRDCGYTDFSFEKIELIHD